MMVGLQGRGMCGQYLTNTEIQYILFFAPSHYNTISTKPILDRYVGGCWQSCFMVTILFTLLYESDKHKTILNSLARKKHTNSTDLSHLESYLTSPTIP
jgi:hypothetical protein